MQINQLPAASSLNNNDKFAVDTTDGITKSITASALVALTRTNSYGSPLVANTVTAMTDTSKVYVYTGNETGYTNGDWYYYNGTAWVSGGAYNSVAVSTDTTLTLSGVAADARAVGDRISAVDTALSTTIADIQEDVEDINLNLATEYDNLAWPVSAGQYCIHVGMTYKANQDIPTIESWNASHWTRTNLGEGLSELGDVQGDIATLNAAIVTERLARQTADTSLNNAVSAEATAREQAVAAEASAREAADTALSSDISAEATAREAADAALNGSIIAEATAREATDDELKSEISDLHNVTFELGDGLISEVQTVITNLTTHSGYRYGADGSLIAASLAVGVAEAVEIPVVPGQKIRWTCYQANRNSTWNVKYLMRDGSVVADTNYTPSGTDEYTFTVPLNCDKLLVSCWVVDGENSFYLYGYEAVPAKQYLDKSLDSIPLSCLNIRDTIRWQMGDISNGNVIASTKRIVTTDIICRSYNIVLPWTDKVFYLLWEYDDIDGNNPIYKGYVNMSSYAIYRIPYIINANTCFRLIVMNNDNADISSLYDSVNYQNTKLFEYNTYGTYCKAERNINVMGIAHQGMGENQDSRGQSRMSALIKACHFGFTHIETDVEWSSDNVPVCCHDATFTDTNTSNVITIAEHTLAELKTYGYYGETILSLEEIIAFCKENGMGLVIDHSYAFTSGQWDIAISLVNKYAMQDKVIWFVTPTGTNPSEWYSKAHIAVLSNTNDLTNDITYAKSIKTDFNNVYIDVNADKMTPTILEDAISSIGSDIKLMMWTVNRIDYLATLKPYIVGLTSDIINFCLIN